MSVWALCPHTVDQKAISQRDVHLHLHTSHFLQCAARRLSGRALGPRSGPFVHLLTLKTRASGGASCGSKARSLTCGSTTSHSLIAARELRLKRLLR